MLSKPRILGNAVDIFIKLQFCTRINLIAHAVARVLSSGQARTHVKWAPFELGTVNYTNPMGSAFAIGAMVEAANMYDCIRVRADQILIV